MSRVRSESGQTITILVFFLFVMILMAGAVMDVGAWFRADRQTQNVADAAALAAAQELPGDPGLATATAISYAGKNGGSISAGNVKYSRGNVDNDTVSVNVTDEAPTVFTKIIGIESVTVGAAAKARASAMGEAKYVAPIAVDVKHPLLQCSPEPCFDQATTLDLTKTGPGAFRLLNLDDSKGGTGQQILADWILNGYSDALPLDWYFQDAGAKFNASEVKAALNLRLGDELLFPVYDLVTGSGSNLEYHVIGWVGFVVTDFKGNGSSGTIDGHFTKVTWDGLASTDPSAPSFGARTISLVE
jgi:Putative Flp pilus-assembly TadE/G-like